MKKAWRLAVVVALVAAGGALAFAGAMPEGFAGVAEVAADPARFEGRAIDVKGTVVEGSLQRAASPVSFLVGDGAAALEVRWDPAHPLPEHEAGGTIEGKSVVVQGHLVREGGRVFLLASQMQVGCASKYRVEDGATDAAA